MKLILLGPPGAGKGTQAHFITEQFKIKQISTGDMLRAAIAAGSELGKQAQSLINAGKFVGDDLIVNLVTARIAAPDCANGFLFDGFPRTLAQAEAVQKAGVKIDAVIEMAVPDADIVQRLSGRFIHPASGRTYHVKHHPPRVAGKDDLTGEDLIQRPDDHEDVIRERLKAYHKMTEVLKDYYQKLGKKSGVHYLAVDGSQPIDAVKKEVLTALAKIK